MFVVIKLERDLEHPQRPFLYVVQSLNLIRTNLIQGPVSLVSLAMLFTGKELN